MEQTAAPRTDRQSWIDLTEALAIFLVLIYHATLYGCDILESGTPSMYFRYWFRTLLSPCVALFFFANGYLLLGHPLNLKKHMGKTLKIVVLVGLWGMLGQILLMPLMQERFSLGELVDGVCWLRDGWINHLWFLCTLAGIYGLFPLIKYVYDNNMTLFGYFALLCGFFSFGNVLIRQCGEILPSLVLRRHIILPGLDFFKLFSPFSGGAYAFVYFCIGGLAARMKDRFLAMDRKKRILFPGLILLVSSVLLWLTGIFYSRTSKQMWDVVWCGYDTVFTLLNTCAISMLCLNYRGQSRLIRLISENTLGIYLIHGILNISCKNWIAARQSLCNLPGTILYAAFLLFASLALTLVLKKIPVLRKLVTLKW